MPRPNVALHPALIVLLSCLVSACGGASSPPTTIGQATSVATAGPSPTQRRSAAPASIPDDAELAAQLQPTLDLYGRAYNENDPALLDRIVDQTNLPFRRYVRAQFDDYQQSVLSGGRVQLRALDIRRREYGFLQAHIRGGSAEAYWLFRSVDGRWVLAEPSEEQLGKPAMIVHKHFSFLTYPWADDVNETVIGLVERARERVTGQLGQTPTQTATVEIRPIYGLARSRYDNAFYTAYYTPSRSKRGPDRITVFAPRTYYFGFYDPVAGWEEELQTLLTHEYTHMVHTRSFDNAGYNTTWMSEGLAEYIADNPRRQSVRAAVRSGNIIPIIDTQSPAFKQDLMHMTTLQRDHALAYGFAYALVRYIVEEHGGLSGFWRLARAYEKTHHLQDAVQQTFNLSFEEFDAGWRAWLKKTY